MSFKHLDRHTEKNPVKMPVMAFAGIFVGFFTMVNARFYQVSFENIYKYMYFIDDVLVLGQHV